MHPVLEMFTILDVKFEGRRLAKIQLRTKQLICLFLMLTSMVLGFSFLPRARAGMGVLDKSGYRKCWYERYVDGKSYNNKWRIQRNV